VDSVLDLIIAKAVELLGSEASAILKYDETRGGLVVVRSHNLPPELAQVFLIKPGEGTVGRAFQERRPVWTRDRHSDPSMVGTDPATNRALRAAPIGGTLSAPIIIRDEVYGVLGINFYRPHDFTEREVQLLQALADSAAVAIGNARFIEATQQARQEAEEAREDAEARQREATQLYEITTQLASSTEVDSVLDLINAKAVELLGSEGSIIMRYDEARGGLVGTKAYNFPPEAVQVLFIRPGDGTVGRAFQERGPVWSRDIRSDPLVKYPDPASDRVIRASEARGTSTVPIIIRDEVYGTLSTVFYTPHDFTEREIQLL
jgi:GAF domain-containing protein